MSKLRAVTGHREPAGVSSTDPWVAVFLFTLQSFHSTVTAAASSAAFHEAELYQARTITSVTTVAKFRPRGARSASQITRNLGVCGTGIPRPGRPPRTPSQFLLALQSILQR